MLFVQTCDSFPNSTEKGMAERAAMQQLRRVLDGFNEEDFKKTRQDMYKIGSWLNVVTKRVGDGAWAFLGRACNHKE